jgi:two-component system, chemotaxis family, sensor kinase Cph1
MAAGPNSDPPDYDLDVCAREPIHVPGAIQPHGVLLVLNAADLSIVQASANAGAWLGMPGGRCALGDLSPDLAAEVGSWADTSEAVLLWGGQVAGRTVQAAAHRSGTRIVVEFEEAESAHGMEALLGRVQAFAEALQGVADEGAVTRQTASFVRSMTGFDRVLVYRFDDEWNGHVVGEDGNGVLPSYLDLRFPAGDIPAQARRLYLQNRLRIIPEVDYRPAAIEPQADPESGDPVDLSDAMLRSVSAVHLEYMRNMGTHSSMSVSIIIGGRLWGLVACHSRAPHGVPPQIRRVCDFAVQLAAAEIAGRVRAADTALRLQLGEVQARLLAAMSAARDWRLALIAETTDLLGLVEAGGAAIVDDDSLLTTGETPSKEDIRRLVEWLERNREGDVLATDSLATRHEPAAGYADAASGVLAVRISELHPSWVLWFRPEVVRTVAWGGDPHKVVREAGRIHPRVSFQAWKEQVRRQAAPWKPAEIAVALQLRASIVGIVLRRAEEMAALAEELGRSNKELEAFSYSVSHDLRAPFRHIVGYAELLRERESELDEKSRHYLESISESALAAGRLVDDLLNFSHVGRASLDSRRIDMQKLVSEVRRSLALSTKGRSIEWSVGRLPTAFGDPTLLRQVWFNLIENAVKYSAPRQDARIAITGRLNGGEAEFEVSDNGVGFDMAYREKLFGVFQRLQRAEDFEGTGIGLALTRRIVERHGGRVWAEGEVDQGATFGFSIPVDANGGANV